MGKRKRPSRPQRRRVAPAPAPKPAAGGNETTPAKETPDVDKAVEVVEDATRVAEANAKTMVVPSDAEKVLTCGKDKLGAAPDGEVSTDVNDTEISADANLQVTREQDADGLTHGDQPEHLQEEGLAITEQPAANEARSEATSNIDGSPVEQICPEKNSKDDLKRPSAQPNPATASKTKSVSTAKDGASKSSSNATEKEVRSGSNTTKSKSKSSLDERESKSSLTVAEKRSKNSSKEPIRTKLPPEDASTQTDDLPEGPTDVRLAASTQTTARTQDQSVTSSDQTGRKEHTASMLVRMQAAGQRMDPATVESFRARRALLDSQGTDATAVAAPLTRPKRPPSGDADDRLSPEAKRRNFSDLPDISLTTPHWTRIDPTGNFLRMRESMELGNQIREQPQQRPEERLYVSDYSKVFGRPTSDASISHRHEIDNFSSNRSSGIRYPNGLVVPQPPPPPRRSSPNRADRASASPPMKQSLPRVRTAEEYVTLDDDEDPMADAIRHMKAKGEFPCRLCNQIFRNLRGMKGHVREHFEKKPPYHCNVCTLFYPDKAALGRHMKIHTGERPYECRRCNFAFTTKANCERHMKNRHKLTREELTDNMNVLPSDSRTVKPRSPPPPTSRAVLTVGGDLTTCTVCDASFGEYTPAVQHVKKFHPTKDPAQVLNARGAVYSSAPSPVESIQRPLALPPLLPLQLPVGLPEGPLSIQSRSSTPRSLPRPASPPAHADDDSVPLDLSQKSERSEVVPEIPQLSMEEAIRSAALMQMPYCMQLPFFMSNMQMMNKQMEDVLAQTRSASLSSGGGILTPAQMQAALQTAFVGALTQVPPTPLAEEGRESEDDNALNLTPTGASSASSTPGALDDPRKKQKQRRYRTVQPFQCVHCGARFTLSTNMDRHVKNTHPDKWEPKSRGARRSATIVSPMASPAEPPSASEPEPSGSAAATVVCVESDDEGGLVIDEPSRDETDLASVDRLVVSAQAQTCQQYFRSDEERSSEGGSERGASASPIGDEDSERAEKRRSAYSNAPNKIPCRYCDRVFPWISSLKRHELTHSGEKPYSCPHCPVHFTTKSNCDRHLVRKHSGGSGSEESSTAQRPVERPFKCVLCPSSMFSTQENLARHHEEKHAQGAAGPATHQFWCHVCDRRFFDLERARDHLEADHEQSWARLERSNSRWVSQIAEEDQGQDQIFCLVCLHGFADTSELRQHMTSEHQSEDTSEDVPCAEDRRTPELPQVASSSPPPARTHSAGPPRKRPTLEDISARLLAGSQLRAVTSSPVEEASSAQEKQETPMECDEDREEQEQEGEEKVNDA